MYLHGHGSSELGRYEVWVKIPTLLLGVTISLAVLTLETSSLLLLVIRLK